MVYLDNAGNRHDRRPFGLHTISEWFLYVVNMFIFFFQTLFSTTDDLPKKSGTFGNGNGRSGGGGGGGGGGRGDGYPKRKMGGFGPGTTGYKPPGTVPMPMGGG
eukprot:CAMPEP_0201509218 /NCGR_PEP_ID=MMETSP0161_2-20130828/2334_1 /ASSEMBLY_ACC=CAM_ASM_000251 /TAXON_ID=180227 /ORGANISM="Neoparamoeba aestuarina, Strain SoJaBio B1-5/56/2" /LENGTH=103 /DNA_ID=CAMNT_0047904115 /DNA_START=164 /DNA_END=475 /DNA_ORIENTATION=-